MIICFRPLSNNLLNRDHNRVYCKLNKTNNDYFEIIKKMIMKIIKIVKTIRNYNKLNI